MQIPYSIYRFTLVAKETLHMPAYKGSTIRGGFGTAFRRVVCALRGTECENCLLRKKCIYAWVFESSPEEDVHIFGRVRSIPKPFVLEPPADDKTTYESGEQMHFNLILVGRAIEYLPYFIYTFEELGKIGIGRGRGRYSLKDVCIKRSSEWRLMYSHKHREVHSEPPSVIDLTTQIQDIQDGVFQNHRSSVILRFETPTRLKYQRRLTIQPEFHILVRQLLRRLFLLWYFHCGGSYTGPKEYHKVLIAMAKDVKLSRNELQWYDWQRYSHRQSQKIRLGGFVGEVEYTGVPGVFMPFLKAGEILHIGKGTTFGLGKYFVRLPC